MHGLTKSQHGHNVPSKWRTDFLILVRYLLQCANPTHYDCCHQVSCDTNVPYGVDNAQSCVLIYRDKLSRNPENRLYFIKLIIPQRTMAEYVSTCKRRSRLSRKLSWWPVWHYFVLVDDRRRLAQGTVRSVQS